jgi:hypothetical protein
MAQMTQFLEEITYREAWIELEAAEAGDLPPYLGSSLRGAVGRLMRPALCEAAQCGDTCQRPDTCKYFAIFERSRTSSGANAPKPLIVEAPLTEALEEIAMGGPVHPPYRSGPSLRGERTPTLENDHLLRVQRGALLRPGLRLVGPLSITLAGIVAAIARYGLQLGGVRFRLRGARDAAGRALYDSRLPRIPAQQPGLARLPCEQERARVVRIAFLTPALVNLGQGITFNPSDLAACFFEHCLARAVQVYNCLTGRPRLPWVEAPKLNYELAGRRLFRYRLPRYTFRQEKRLEFDGVVGYIDLAGELDPGMPFARAAEVLHFGQKATFGLGKVRVLVLD